MNRGDGAVTAHTDPGRSARSLPGELYLLACDPEKERQQLGKRELLVRVVRAAALIDLTERGCLRDESGRARAVGDRRTGDPVLDEVLRDIAEERPRRWKPLVERHRRRTFTALEQQLQRDGSVAFERRALRPTRIRVRDGDEVAALRKAAAETLHGRLAAAEVPPRRAALTVLAALGEVPGVTTGRERRKLKKRIDALSEQAGAAGPALLKAIKAMQAAQAGVAAAAASGGAAGGS
jgi:hypothetical protein